LGAIGVAKFPDGSLEQSGEMFRHKLLELADRRSHPSTGAPGAIGGEATLALSTDAVQPSHVAEEVPS
jgi:hypothetical protein